MGRGNVCVAGPHEGLYYIDNDHFHVYRRDEPGVEYPETRLMGDLSYDELTGNEWLYDEWGTGEEEDDILECFISSFVRMFPSFERPMLDKWLTEPGFGGRSRRVILESKLFYIAVEDNEWSLAVELLQKEDPYDDHLSVPPGSSPQHWDPQGSLDVWHHYQGGGELSEVPCSH